MSKENSFPSSELEPAATALAEVFFQRRDLYARQVNDGSYICVRKPIETSHLVAHLAGKITLGTYVLDPSNQAMYIAFDADDEPQFERLISLSRDLENEKVPSYLEESRRGGHLWLFFSNPHSGKEARLFARRISEKRHMEGIEIFPKQDKLSSGPGSLIRLPFGVHRKTGKRYGFLTPDRQPLAASIDEQYRILSAPETVPDDFIKSKMAVSSPSLENPVVGGVESPTVPLSQRIKESIGIANFIGQYVELSPAGRGLCPFHVDQHTSFSVNAEKNYWHCFAGCGGGSIIDFWMKWQGCDFTQAIHELAEILLQPAQKAKEPEVQKGS